MASIGTAAFAGVIDPVLRAVGEAGEVAVVGSQGFGEPTLLDERDVDLLRGLVWAAALVRTPAMYQALGRAAEAAFNKVPGQGPRSVKIGRACLEALLRGEGFEAAAELSRLAARVKHPAGRKEVENALATCARRPEAHGE